MPRMKKTAKRQRDEDVVYMEPPMDRPLAKYFSRLDDLNNYLINFAEKKIIPPRLNKSEYEIDSNTLANIWDLDKVDTIDCCLLDGSKTPENWGAHVKRSAIEMFNIQRAPKKKILCTVFNAEMRVLHYLINYTIMPRSSGHGHVLVDDLVSM
ncbi:hypothetical protein PIB30_056300 [Stylosanthes scabra]|uniref:Uncharacterized protein n=1 Tax=Stylosanthes scabra TaxID=79078 RepID=A0ABU6ZI07_9FABA|nr:hypothetical protein [Stylosanthes scabra]